MELERQGSGFLTGLIAVMVCAACAPGGGRTGETTMRSVRAEAPLSIRVTWLSVTNWLIEAGETRILLDAYLTRVDRTTLADDGSSTAPATVDQPLLSRIATAVIPDRRLDWILVGQGHWDHAFDAPALADLTGARIGGSRTVCHQALALGIDAARCMPLEGGEAIDVAPAVRVRVVRWHHSGDSTTENGRRLRAPLELEGPPPTDPATGGLRPGYLEDYPNGGGSRGYLIIVRTVSGRRSIFWSTTGNHQAWDTPVPADSVLLRELGVDLSHLEWAASEQSTRDALDEALRAEGLRGVDLWIGFPGAAHVRQVAPLLRPRSFIPQHWDDFWEPTLNGLRPAFSPAAAVDALAELGTTAVIPTNYFERFRVDAGGVTPEGDGGIRARLGVPEER